MRVASQNSPYASALPAVAQTGRHLLSILAESFSPPRNPPFCLKVAHYYCTVSAMAGPSRSSTSTLHRPGQFPTAYLDLSVSSPLYYAPSSRAYASARARHYPDIWLGTSPRLHSRCATLGLEPYLSCRPQR